LTLIRIVQLRFNGLIDAILSTKKEERYGEGAKSERRASEERAKRRHRVDQQQ